MNKLPDRFLLPVTAQGWNYIRQLLDGRPHGEVRGLVDALDAAVAQQIEQANAPPQQPDEPYRPEQPEHTMGGKANGRAAPAAEQEHKK